MEIFIFWIILSFLVGLIGKDRKIGFGMAFLWAVLLSPIIGAIIALSSKKKSSIDEQHKFVQYKELAKKAEFKGQYSKAIDYYMDCLYHLENDYKKIDARSEQGRQKHIKEVRAKIESLKSHADQKNDEIKTE